MAEDKNLVCRDCGVTFVYTAGEQTFYAEKGLSDPIRCRECRRARKAQRAASEGFAPVASSPPAGRSFGPLAPPASPRPFNRHPADGDGGPEADAPRHSVRRPPGQDFATAAARRGNPFEKKGRPAPQTTRREQRKDEEDQISNWKEEYEDTESEE